MDLLIQSFRVRSLLPHSSFRELDVRASVHFEQKHLRGVKFVTMIEEIPEAQTGETDCLRPTMLELTHEDIDLLARGQEHDQRTLAIIYHLVIDMTTELSRVTELYQLEELPEHLQEIERRLNLVVSTRQFLSMSTQYS